MGPSNPVVSNNTLSMRILEKITTYQVGVRLNSELEETMNSIVEKKTIISDFIRQCSDYADGQLRKYQARLEQAEAMEALDIEAKIYHWKVYKAFNAYTIEELKTDELDAWFDET